MGYTVKQLAKLSGVTPRTLRWYDETGLLQPQRAHNGYRLYTEAELSRLQQILFYREAGMELAQIAILLDAPNFDAERALSEHIKALQARKDELDALIATAKKTLQTVKGDLIMTDKEKFEGFKQDLIDKNETQYGEEVRERWGNNTADTSNAKMMNMTKDEYEAFTLLSNDLNNTLDAAIKEGDAAGETAQKAAALHKKWLCYTWPNYSTEAHKNLVQMYVDDERFTEYYEKIAPGAARFLRDAVVIYLKSGNAES